MGDTSIYRLAKYLINHWSGFIKTFSNKTLGVYNGLPVTFGVNLNKNGSYS